MANRLWKKFSFHECEVVMALNTWEAAANLIEKAKMGSIKQHQVTCLFCDVSCVPELVLVADKVINEPGWQGGSDLGGSFLLTGIPAPGKAPGAPKSHEQT
ncbi:Torsin-4A [Manis javanica]|nr:Torsin-4A [Manis javanica]